MVKKARLGLYLEDEEMKRRIKVAAARMGVSTTAYCANAIRERLAKDGEMDSIEKRKALLAHMDALREEIGPIGVTAAELIKEGRRR